jgi:hypothetical protein
MIDTWTSGGGERRPCSGSVRRQGVQANATPAQIRGRLSDHPRDGGVYWAAQRGALRSERAHRHRRKLEPASLGRIIDTAERVQGDWFATGGTLHAQGLRELTSLAVRRRARGPAAETQAGSLASNSTGTSVGTGEFTAPIFSCEVKALAQIVQLRPGRHHPPSPRVTRVH